MILGELRDRTKVYQSIRRVRPPTTMNAPVGPRIHAHEYRRNQENARHSGSVTSSGASEAVAPTPEIPGFEFKVTSMAAIGEQFYAPPGPMSPQNSSDTSSNINLAGSGSSGSPGNDPMLDIDWVSL